jgi:predicted MPP superfamily phosphohydrolase
VDIAAELGHKPVGRGRHSFLARLPGNEIFQVDFTERTLCLPTLPTAWDGLSILHLSDLHLCGTPDRPFYEEVLQRCAGWKADLVALTGDVVDGPEYRGWIVPLLGRLRWRVAGFAILGNHDCWHEPPLIRKQLERAGLRVVGNTWEQMMVRGEPLAVIGHEGPWFRPEPDLTDCPQDVFRLCLSHTPDNVFWGRRHAVDLMLSGHNHGGQVRLPLLGSVLVPSRYGRRFDCGLFEQGPTVLHVSRGLGGSHPLRFNCRPEVTRLVLRCGKPAARHATRPVRPQAVRGVGV